MLGWIAAASEAVRTSWWTGFLLNYRVLIDGGGGSVEGKTNGWVGVSAVRIRGAYSTVGTTVGAVGTVGTVGSVAEG